MAEKSALRAALILNLVMVALEIVGAVMIWRQLGVWMFQYCTQDSNLLTLAACALLAAFQLRALRTDTDIPRWAQRLKYAAVCCLSVTFLVIVLVLTPMSGGAYGMLLFEGTMLYHHLLCPLTAFFGFILFEKRPALRRVDALLPAVLTLLYATVLTALNMARVVDGPLSVPARVRPERTRVDSLGAGHAGRRGDALLGAVRAAQPPRAEKRLTQPSKS